MQVYILDYRSYKIIHKQLKGRDFVSLQEFSKSPSLAQSRDSTNIYNINALQNFNSPLLKNCYSNSDDF